MGETDTDQPKRLLHDFFYDGSRISTDDNDVIYDSESQEAYIFLVEKGYLKSYTINSDGDLNILNFYGPGSIFPLAPILRRALDWTSFRVRQTVYFETMTEAVVYRRRADEFTLDGQSPSVYKELMYRLLQNYEIYLNCTQVQQFRHARDRIIYQLLLMADMYGSSMTEGTMINIPLTHRDLGSTIGMARETVTRELEKLRSKGHIKTENYHITLFDPTRLENELEYREQ